MGRAYRACGEVDDNAFLPDAVRDAAMDWRLDRMRFTYAVAIPCIVCGGAEPVEFSLDRIAEWRDAPSVLCGSCAGKPLV